MACNCDRWVLTSVTVISGAARPAAGAAGPAARVVGTVVADAEAATMTGTARATAATTAVRDLGCRTSSPQAMKGGAGPRWLGARSVVHINQQAPASLQTAHDPGAPGSAPVEYHVEFHR